MCWWVSQDYRIIVSVLVGVRQDYRITVNVLVGVSGLSYYTPHAEAALGY